MGAGVATQTQMESFLLRSNPGVDRSILRELVRAYVEESAREGVNHDVAFAQMCVETGFLKFGGLVTADMHNYAGLGSLGPGKPGERFPSPRVGVQAQVQHLKAYASEEPLRGQLVDPRFKYVRRGSASTIASLAGKWAADPRYGEKITSVIERLYAEGQ